MVTKYTQSSYLLCRFQVQCLDDEDGMKQIKQELKQHVNLIHKYNELKDATVLLLGKLAMTQGVTVKSLYDQFGLQTED